MTLRLTAVLVVLVCWSASAWAVTDPSQVKDENNAVKMLAEYFDLLVSGNQESAMYLWTPAVLDRAQRLGITYSGIPLKVDCSSPVVRNIPVMRRHLHPPVKAIYDLDSAYCRLLYSQLVAGDLVEHHYYAFYDGQYYWLTYPQDFYSANWPITRSRYFAIHTDPAALKQLNPVVLQEADSFVERLADSLDLSDSDLEHLAAGKIEYYYCGSDSLIHEMTGFRIKGTYDLATDDIVSAFFPHYHEIVHLLINYKLRTLPLYTQPIIREGVAVYYGGRWGKAPSALLDLGAFLYREKIVDLDSLLTMREFDANSSADIAYPVAGLFVSYLLDNLEREAFWTLYRELSGDFSAVNDMTRMQMKDRLAIALGQTEWSVVLDGFDAYISRVVDERVPVLPGVLADGKTALESDGYRIVADKEWLGFEFTRPTGTAATGNLLFGKDERLVGGGSELYLKQYQDAMPFEGYRFGIRFDQYEVGLYDYATDHLLAKYIWGITPSDEYYDEATNRVTVRFRKDLFDTDMLNKTKDCLLLEQ
ncbi:MAG: hypothetical protein ABIE70_02665 [bacterium]